MLDASRCAGVFAVLFIALGSTACSEAGTPTPTATDTDAAWIIFDLPEGFVEESEKYVAGSRISDHRGDGCRFSISMKAVPVGEERSLRTKRRHTDTCEMVMAVGSFPDGRPGRTTNSRVLQTNRPDNIASMNGRP